MNRRKAASILFGILALCWIGVLFFFSGQSGTDSESLSLWTAGKLIQWFPWIGMTAEAFNPILRKLAHMGVFAVEGFLLGSSLINAVRPRRGAGISALLCVGMAAANEYHQTFSEGRSCQIMDVLIDSSGALLGIAAAAILAAFSRAIGARRKAGKRNSLGAGD